MQAGYINEAQLDALRAHLMALYKAVRPDAVAYVDGFDFTDRHLSSALGRYDGQVYESLYEFARNYPMNKTEVCMQIYICYLNNVRLG